MNSFSEAPNTQDDVLFSGLIDLSLLKRPNEVLPKADQFHSDLTQIKQSNTKAAIYQPQSPYLVGITHAILNNNPDEAWSEFQRAHIQDVEVLRGLSRIQWSLLLSLLTRFSSKDSSWVKVKTVFESMIHLGYQPTASESTRVIGLASKYRDLNSISEIWNLIMSSNIPRTTNLWNCYIKATCNADPALWTRKFNGTRPKSRQQEPAAINNAVDLIAQMVEEGIAPNASTYELALLYLGQCGQLEQAESLISSLWGVSLESAEEDGANMSTQIITGDPNYPTYFTLVAIVNAFGVSNSLVTSLKLMESMQKKYSIDIGNNVILWKSLIRWAFLTSEPYGSTPPVAFDLIWKMALDQYKLTPDRYMILLKLKQEYNRRDFEAASELLPLFFTLQNGQDYIQHIASSLRRTAKGFVKNGKVEKCNDLLERWAPLNPLFQSVADDVQKYIAARHEATL